MTLDEYTPYQYWSATYILLVLVLVLMMMMMISISTSLVATYQ